MGIAPIKVLHHNNNTNPFADQTHYLVNSARNISVTGAIQAFDEEFKLMQSHIDEIRKILASVNFTQGDIQDIENMLETIK